MIEAVIFDMDGLLIDSEPFWREAERAVFREAGVELTDSMCEEAMGLRVNEVLHHWFKKFQWPSPDFESMENEIIQKVGNLMRHNGALMPGARETVEFFRDKKIPIALASASAQFLIQTFLHKFEFDAYFEVIHSAEHEQYGKPHPAVFLSTAEQLSVPPTRCLVFEDSFNGLLAAKAARMACVVVPEPRIAHEAKWVIADMKLSSLLSFNKELWQTIQIKT